MFQRIKKNLVQNSWKIIFIVLLPSCSLAPPQLVELKPKEFYRSKNPEIFEETPAPNSIEAENTDLPINTPSNKTFRADNDSPLYLLGPGDELELLLLGERDLKPLALVVGENGIATFPYVGHVEASGKTIPEIVKHLESKLTDFLRNPTVGLRLTAPKAHPIYLLIQDKEAKVLYLDGRTTLGELLASNYAGSEKTRVALKRGDSTWEFSLPSALTGKTESAIVLDEGDVITVETPERGHYFVIGEVAKQGKYQMSGDRTDLLHAIAEAGGFGINAMREVVAVLRPGSGGYSIVPTPVDGRTQALENNDVVYVGRSKIGDWNTLLEQLQPTLNTINLTSTSEKSIRNLGR